MDGKKVREEILASLKEKVSKVQDEITLAIIYIGSNDASDLYVNNKIKYADQVGIKTKLCKLPEDVSEEEVESLIDKLNNDETVYGIILQSPISKHLDFNYLSGLISSEKDVDGFTTVSVYDNYINKQGLLPCTVKGIIRLLDYYGIQIEGKRVVIIGRSIIVGKPLMLAMLNRNATVTIAHSKTENLEEVCKSADILISAVGKARLITNECVKQGAIVIDVGINKVDGKTVGDVDFEDVKDKCDFITPVPGGVGPMTIAMLLENTYEAYKEIKNGYNFGKRIKKREEKTTK
jgi:methylenetetrahydrofolate dehydrogenase (NADP+)/methenyltetrahydrofolate cyclohydrolase